jgi:hypothetical protein
MGTTPTPDRLASRRQPRRHLPLRADLLGRLGELRGKALGCWCAPELCHADVLAKLLETDK